MVVAKIILIYSVKFSIMPMKGSSLPECLCTTTGNPCSKENGVSTHQPEAGTQHELSTRIQRSNEMVLPPVFQAEHSAHGGAFGAFITEHCFIATYKKKDLGSAMHI